MSPPTGLERRDRRPRRVEAGPEVELHHVAPVAEVAVLHLADLGHAGRVDEDVEAAEVIDRVLHRVGGFPLVGHVGRPGERLSAGGLDLGRQVEQPVGPAGDQRHLRPRRGEGDGGGPADPRRGAGDQGRLPGQDASHGAYPRRWDM